ncbi:cuticle protein 7-like [Macrobrachium rosenbergii]|uniref:cuticle protein 7-like n=1 Tax=Macrobrachium rosenbergii TaxID=79674 RepID=UPI0034D5C780
MKFCSGRSTPPAHLHQHTPTRVPPPGISPTTSTFLSQAGTYKAEPEYPDVPPKYTYNYGVADDYSGAAYGHNEARDGYKTEGSYTVDLPDGRKQTVTYVDNGDGLIAEVTYEGEAVYPEYKPAYPAPPKYPPTPKYPPPPPPPPAYEA